MTDKDPLLTKIIKGNTMLLYNCYSKKFHKLCIKELYHDPKRGIMLFIHLYSKSVELGIKFYPHMLW